MWGYDRYVGYDERAHAGQLDQLLKMAIDSAFLVPVVPVVPDVPVVPAYALAIRHSLNIGGSTLRARLMQVTAVRNLRPRRASHENP